MLRPGHGPVDPLLSPPKLLADLFAVGHRQLAMIYRLSAVGCSSRLPLVVDRDRKHPGDFRLKLPAPNDPLFGLVA